MGWLYTVSRKMKNTKGGNALFNLLDDLGIRIALGRFSNWRSASYDARRPNIRMKNSAKFFTENRERVQAVLSLLADRESKEVLTKMIRFRCYSNYRDLPHNSMRSQYFVNSFFHDQENEMYIDCGAYDGDSVRAFKKHMRKIKSGGGKITAFEPDPSNYRRLVRSHPDITAVRAGVWDKNGMLLFEKGGSGSSFLDGGKTIELHHGEVIKVPVIRMDDMEECKKATFIKLDVEGSEYNALLGAQNIIRSNKPKLAVCIYHSDEDMLRLIELVHELVPEYRLFVRQHSNSIGETVLYAVL